MPEGDVFGPNERPLTLTRDELLAVLDDLRNWVANDDSMEGRLAYEWGTERDTYNVSGVLRFGNSMGQGSVRMLRKEPGT